MPIPPRQLPPQTHLQQRLENFRPQFAFRTARRKCATVSRIATRALCKRPSRHTCARRTLPLLFRAPTLPCAAVDLEITLPHEVPVMTLPNVALFPQALMPLHIFEPRYRAMLTDVLATNRLFAVAGLNPRLASEPGQFEPLHRIGSVGIVRACQANADGTSNLLLHGLCRVEFLRVVAEEPYRRVEFRVLASATAATGDEISRLRTELARLLRLKQRLDGSIPPAIADFLRKIEDPEVFVDLAAFSLCDRQPLKQQLLETLDVRERLALFARQVGADIQALKLRRKLQGPLPDDLISDN